GKPQKDDKEFINSGCSRHMTGNIAYLLDFKEFDGGYVTFGGGAHGGRIYGKGTHKTDGLDFEDVYFDNELKFNIFSVSQMSNKKNYVLFTNIECLVLSSNFKLPDESWILLKIPRRFTWVFFLATKDETSEILKNFIKEIENLVDKKVKIIRCDNGTEFKNKVMDDFCREKGIRREYSIARTPQQNGVAERRNMTLIEAARTMLADSKLPTTFWAEAVSTACYVQNRVLVFREFDGKSDEGTSTQKEEISQDCIVMPIWKDASYFDSPSKDVGNGRTSKFKLQRVWILVNLPIGKRAIGNKMEVIDKRSIDYEEVFAPVARIEAIRLFLAYASFMGFLVYVDDIIFGSTNKELCTAFEKLIKDNQDKYVDEIFKKFNYTNVKSVSTPVDLEKPLVKDEDANDVNVHLYRSMIRFLMYLTTSRPDIIFACKKQTMVATSTTEAKYVAAASLLTKGFDAGRFQYLVSSIGMLNP
ncbi:ribonuclease H-like domain-containing protein, partial [Tanacetum coccineum]